MLLHIFMLLLFITGLSLIMLIGAIIEEVLNKRNRVECGGCIEISDYLEELSKRKQLKNKGV